MLRLIVNVIKNDIAAPNQEHTCALALNTVGNIGGAEFSENLFSDITKLLQPQVSPYVKRKAFICLLRLYRKDTDTIQLNDDIREDNALDDIWVQRFLAVLSERDVGVLISGCGLILGVLEYTERIGCWKSLIPEVIKIIRNIVLPNQDPGSTELIKKDHIYYTVKAPWLQVKLLRILQFYPKKYLEPHARDINAVLDRILATTPMV